MTLPANLFVDTPEMQDASMHQLGTDVELWPEEIIQKAKERLPRSGGLNLMVKFMKKDEENGVATGSVIISSSDKAVVLPIIVKDFMLYPMDVMIAQGKLLPATPQYFDELFSNNKIFAKIEEYPTYGGLGRFEDANLWNTIYPPSLGRYAYASAGYPIMDAISDKLDGASLKEFLMKNEKVAARLLTGPHKDLVKKVANLRPVNMNEFRQGVENLIPKSISMLRYDGPNKYTLLSDADSVFHPGLTPMTRHEALSYASELSDHAEDDINDVDQNGEKFLQVPAYEDSVIIAFTDKEIPESADDFDHYSVKSKSGVNVEGYVIPRVIDFNQKPVDLKLFIGKTMSTMQPEIWGVRIKNSRFKLPKHAPRVGQTGTFVYQPDASHALATMPVTIKAVIEEGSELKLKVADLMGRPMVLKYNRAVKMERIAPMGGSEYLMPHAMKWVPMEGFSEVSNSAADYAVKTAAHMITSTPVTVIHTGYGNYSVKGVEKYATAAKWDATNLDRAQTKLLLASLGANQEKIAAIFEKVGMRGSYAVHGLKFKPLLSEKYAELKPRIEKLKKLASGLRSNLIKEASYLENSQTVDAMLALNFVSPDNIMKFVGKIPQMKGAISTLASCLIASRLGIKEIPEQAASTAMTRLVEVVDGLEKLRATQEIGVA